MTGGHSFLDRGGGGGGGGVTHSCNACPVAVLSRLRWRTGNETSPTFQGEDNDKVLWLDHYLTMSKSRRIL